MKALRSSLVALFALSALWAPSAAGASSAAASVPCGAQDAFEVVQLHTFHVEMKAKKAIVKRNGVAVVNMTVIRPAKQDPVGAEQEIDPPHTEPAADVDIGIGAFAGDVYLYGTSVTDDKGKATIKIKVPSYTPKGKVAARALAQKEVVSSPCASVYEFGYTETSKLFTVK